MGLTIETTKKRDLGESMNQCICVQGASLQDTSLRGVINFTPEYNVQERGTV